MTPNEKDPRESTVSILVAWRVEREVARGASEDRAREIADREIRILLERCGGRRWYFPLAFTQTGQALAFRDEAIRKAVQHGATFAIIKRSFRGVSRGHFYRILNGNRNGRIRKQNGEAA